MIDRMSKIAGFEIATGRHDSLELLRLLWPRQEQDRKSTTNY